MKKIFLLLSAMSSMACCSLLAQAPAIEWTHSYGSSYGNQENWIYDIAAVANDEYFIGGFTEVSSVYTPVLGRFYKSPPCPACLPELIWETQVADAGVITDIIYDGSGVVYAIGTGYDPENSDEQSILFVSVDASTGSIITGPVYINKYSLTSLSSSYTVEGTTIEPIMDGERIDGFVVCGSYDDLTYGLHAGTVVMIIDEYGAVDASFNSSTGFRALAMHPGYPVSVPPFAEAPFYGRSMAIVSYSSGDPDGIVVAGSYAASSSDHETGVFVTKLEMDGDIAYSCPDNPLSESVLVSQLSYNDNYTSTSPQCTDNGSSSFIDAGDYPYSNENNNAKLGDILQSSYNGNIILGLQLDYYFIYNVTCSLSPIAPPSYINADFTLVELDASDLSLVTSKNIGHFTAIDYSTPVIDDGSGFTVLGGEIDDSGPDDYMNNYVIKTNYGFTTQWESAYFGEGDYIDCPFALCMTPDGGYLLGGNNDLNDEDYNVIKLEPPGSRKPNPELAGNMQANVDLQTDAVTLFLDQPLKTNAVCNLYATDGRLVKSIEVASGTDKYNFSVNGFITGVYFVELKTNDGLVYRQKIAVQK